MAKTTKRKHTHSLNFEQRVRMVDWLRANADKLAGMAPDEIVKVCGESIGHPCSLMQVREAAKASKVPWVHKRRRAANGNDKTRLGRLEARIANIEQQLGIKPPAETELPSDADLD